ncbi:MULTISPECIES: DivIVA domain-containing protein [Aerococcus]|nr:MULTISPECIES: DivIVA domain-containing protein [Aerococcus]MDK6369110.1 DivIVA domain-containing protein [Aerococcus sp. UMB9870]MDK6686603.1 DivIVA domain-containing protein [Aerococcus sp. UMB8623]MDK6939753.1 DivIVA domain-containing protein [Aerococcus sp. UMB8487]OFK17459.1 hypothetical protein HMPREF2829_08435 [Aerococcus sp. HMSC072A12]OFR33453.1 hypothetical protein HMPREF2892_06485 [Aerococcus sp. HMSC061A03]
MNASDLKDKTFKSKLSGYDKQEVDSFLQEVRHAMDNLETLNQYMQQEIFEKNAQLDEFRGKESALNRSIVVAQEAADKLREEALNEAELIVSRAEESAKELLTEAGERAVAVDTETTYLQQHGQVLRGQLMGLIHNSQQSLEDERWDKIFTAREEARGQCPNLEDLIADLDLPVRNDKAAEIFDLANAQVDEAKQKEEFFNNDQVAVMPEEVKEVLEPEDVQHLTQGQAPQEEPANSEVDSSESDQGQEFVFKNADEPDY